MEFMKNLKNKENAEVKQIRCDNAGENQKIGGKAKELGLEIKFRYTAPNTPQQTGFVETKFVTVYGRVQTMFKCENQDQEGTLDGMCQHRNKKLEHLRSRCESPFLQSFTGRIKGLFCIYIDLLTIELCVYHDLDRTICNSVIGKRCFKINSVIPNTVTLGCWQRLFYKPFDARNNVVIRIKVRRDVAQKTVCVPG